MTFNAYAMSAPLALAASRKALRQSLGRRARSCEVVRDRAWTVQFPCEFDSRRAENTSSYGICRTKYGIRVTNVRVTYINRAFLNRTYTVLSPCEFKMKGKIVTGRRVCCSCSKFAATVYGRLACLNFARWHCFVRTKATPMRGFLPAETP